VIQPAELQPADLFPLAAAGLRQAAADYVLLGHVQRARRRGPRIAAEVQGSDAVYACSVDIERDAGGLRLSPRCDCPSQRPYCKHVLAALQLWSTQPEAFTALDAAEAALRQRPAEDLAELLATLAMGEGDALQTLDQAAAVPDWAALSPGRCLQAWERFRSDALASSAWPAAALDLGLRIAGAPGSTPRHRGADAALPLRQLCWWLTLLLPDLPPPALQPWLRHLCTQLEAARLGAEPAALPPELGAWLARLAAALPAPVAADRRWLARFAAEVPTLRAVCAAQLQVLLWSEELAVRLAVSPALPEPVAGRCREALDAMGE